MKILIFAYQDERIAYVDVHQVSDDARQPTTDEEMDAVSPRPLASNHQLEVVEDAEADERVRRFTELGYTLDTAPATFQRYWAPWMPGRPSA